MVASRDVVEVAEHDDVLLAAFDEVAVDASDLRACFSRNADDTFGGPYPLLLRWLTNTTSRFLFLVRIT